MRTICLLLLLATSVQARGLNLGQIFSPDNILQNIQQSRQRQRPVQNDNIDTQGLQAQQIDTAIFNHIKAQDEEIAKLRADVAILHKFCVKSRDVILELRKELRAARAAAVK